MINSNGDIYCYLNARHTLETVASTADAGFFSKLHQALATGSQGKAPPKQWAATIRALQTKGVKLSELKDSKVLEQLEASMERSLTREQVGAIVLSGLPTVKEIELRKTRYDSYRHPGGTYREYLYVLNSHRDNVQDELSELEYRLESMQYDAADLAFSLETLMDDPDLPVKMQAQMKALRALLPVAWDFAAPHFSSALDGTVDKNLMAHARVTERGALYFVEELQSDWAQQGGKAARRAGRQAVVDLIRTKLGTMSADESTLVHAAIKAKASIEIRGVAYKPTDPEMLAAAELGRSKGWGGAIPAAPFVTNTEEWSGLLLRRQMQRAAMLPAVTQFAWITEGLRNGGRAGGGKSLDDFYLNILPKIADKVLKPLGAKVSMGTVEIAGQPHTVPQFEMTPAMKEVLRGPMPMYSLSPVWKSARNGQEEVNRVLAECDLMMGTTRHVKLMDTLYDLATARQVAGKYINNGILLNLCAQDLDRAARHEAWHFATENMLTVDERVTMQREFASHKPIARRTQQTLIDMGEIDAARQCSHPEECAAHAFALWSTGAMEITEPQPRGIFQEVWAVLKDCGRWLNERIAGQPTPTTETIFQALRSGEMARSREARGHWPRPMDVAHGAVGASPAPGG
ncbi:hypothetical protein [Variovorax gossypii]|uniref:hypothetical protein n=1 Tax=uncultured Variovorax sp. TaxID=114708 RepID=UPI00262DF5A4|nr:hypothetical protein [uncultured Variovorax sp.]